MSQKAVIAKREKSLAEQIVIIALLGLMMASFWYYFVRQEESISKAGFGVIANQFFSQVSTIRGQWYMDKNPKEVWLKERDDQGGKRKVTVNQQGWVDSRQEIGSCAEIWQMVMNTPLVFMNKPIAAIEVHDNGDHRLRYCRFVVSSGEYFQYIPQSGEVIKN